MSLRAKAYLFLLATALVAGGAYVFQTYTFEDGTVRAKSEKSAAEKEKEQAAKAVPVEVETAVEGSISAHVSSTANLRALRSVEIMARREGVVTGVPAEEGDFVRKGQELCRLDDRELLITLELTKQQLAQTRAQLESAKIRREKARIQIANKTVELTRNEKALEAGLVADTDVELIRHQLDELRQDERVQAVAVTENSHRVDELGSEIERVELQISQTRVTAPFSGRITERTVELGQTVRSSDALFSLASFSPLFADVHLSERDSRRVRPGQQARITLGSDGSESESALGRVVRISPVVDDQTGTVKTTVELRSKNANFRPGAFVRVSIRTDTREETVLIPKRAVLEQDGETYLFVSENDTARRRTVELGYEDGAAIEVLSGVRAGEKVVVAGQGALKEGDPTREAASG